MNWSSFILNFFIFLFVAQKYGAAGVGSIALYNLFSINGLGGLLDFSLSAVMQRELTRASTVMKVLLLNAYIRFFLFVGALVVTVSQLLKYFVTISEIIVLALSLLPLSLLLNVVKQKYYSEGNFNLIGTFILLIDLSRLGSVYWINTENINALVNSYAFSGAIMQCTILVAFLRYNFVQITTRKVNIIMKQAFFLGRYQIASRGTSILTSQAERIIFSFVSVEALGIIEIITKIPNTILRFTGIVSNVFITIFAKGDLGKLHVQNNIRHSALLNLAGFIILSMLAALLSEKYFSLVQMGKSDDILLTYNLMLVSISLLSFHFVFNIVLTYNVATSSLFRYKVLFSLIKVCTLLGCLQFMPAENALALAWIASCLSIVPFLNLYANYKIFSKFSVLTMQVMIMSVIFVSVLIILVDV